MSKDKSDKENDQEERGDTDGPKRVPESAKSGELTDDSDLVDKKRKKKAKSKSKKRRAIIYSSNDESNTESFSSSSEAENSSSSSDDSDYEQFQPIDQKFSNKLPSN